MNVPLSVVFSLAFFAFSSFAPISATKLPPVGLMRDTLPNVIKTVLRPSSPSVCWKAAESRECRPDEELTVGSCCPQSCAQLRRKNQACVGTPVKGCFCKPGTVYDEDFLTCILPQNCKLCGKNECFVKQPPLCPETCDNKDLPRCLALRTSPGCVCLDGYVRSAEGKCVRRQMCDNLLLL